MQEKEAKSVSQQRSAASYEKLANGGSFLRHGGSV